MSDRSFKARFRTTCLVCHEPIEEGDWAVYDRDGQVIHEDCDQEKDHRD